MASIERTAYPRLKRTVSPADLDEYYTPSAEEVALARSWTRGPSPLLSALLLLKTFQRLGYFPTLAEVPQPIVDHVRRSAGLLPLVAPESGERALSNYRQAIRATLGVVRFEEGGREIASAAVKDHPADLVNVAFEELFRHGCELPAFGTLDALARHQRAAVNRRLYELVLGRLSDEERSTLDALLESGQQGRRSAFALLKQPPRRATLRHLEDLPAGEGERNRGLTGPSIYSAFLPRDSPLPAASTGRRRQWRNRLRRATASNFPRMRKIAYIVFMRGWRHFYFSSTLSDGRPRGDSELRWRTPEIVDGE